MSHHQSDCEGDKAQITSLTPEPEEIKYSKSGVPLHMLDSIQIQELPEGELDEDIGIEEALTTLWKNSMNYG